MQKTFSLKLLYLYLASFTALLFFLFGTVLSVGNVVDLINGPVYYSTYTQYRTNFATGKDGEVIQEDTPELRAAYEEEKDLSLKQDKKRTVQNLAGSGSALVLGLVFWLFFWKQAKLVKEN